MKWLTVGFPLDFFLVVFNAIYLMYFYVFLIEIDFLYTSQLKNSPLEVLFSDAEYKRMTNIALGDVELLMKLWVLPKLLVECSMDYPTAGECFNGRSLHIFLEICF